MRLWYFVPLLLLPPLCGAACRRPAGGAAVSVPAPASAREDRVKLDRLYYRAVEAYAANDMGGAAAYVKEILALSPSYGPALELREKIRKVTGK